MIAWDAVQGSEINSYEIDVRLLGSSNIISTESAALSQSYEVGGLEVGTSYSFTLYSISNSVRSAGVEISDSTCKSYWITYHFSPLLVCGQIDYLELIFGLDM